MPNRLQRLDQVDDFLLYRLSNITRTVGSLVVRLCEGRYGVTRREWAVVGLLAVRSKQTLAELFLNTNLDKARASRIMASMVQKGLVHRLSEPSDRRRVTFTLTEAGHRLHAELLPVVRALNRELLDSLAADDIALLDAWIDRLQQRADDIVERHSDQWPRTQRRKGGSARVKFP